MKDESRESLAAQQLENKRLDEQRAYDDFSKLKLSGDPKKDIEALRDETISRGLSEKYPGRRADGKLAKGHPYRFEKGNPYRFSSTYQPGRGVPRRKRTYNIDPKHGGFISNREVQKIKELKTRYSLFYLKKINPNASEDEVNKYVESHVSKIYDQALLQRRRKRGLITEKSEEEKQQIKVTIELPDKKKAVVLRESDPRKLVEKISHLLGVEIPIAPERPVSSGPEEEKAEIVDRMVFEAVGEFNEETRHNRLRRRDNIYERMLRGEIS